MKYKEWERHGREWGEGDMQRREGKARQGKESESSESSESSNLRRMEEK